MDSEPPAESSSNAPERSESKKWMVVRDSLILVLLLLAAGLIVWKVNYNFPASLIVGFLLFAFFLWKVLSYYLNADSFAQKKDFVDLHAKILGSAALVISLLFTWWGIKNNQSTSEKTQLLTLQSLQNAERRQIEDRYSKALEQLGSEKIEARLGAIYSLGKIAADSVSLNAGMAKAPDQPGEIDRKPASKDFHWEIMQTLASYIRGNAPRTSKKTRPSSEMPTDIQAALNVLAWRGRYFQTGTDGETQRLDLHGADLRGLLLKSIEPAREGDSYEGAHLEGAQLYNVDLEDANLRGINLQGAILSGANLKNAQFHLGNLEGTDLTDANLEGVDFGQTKGLNIDQIMLAKNWEKIRTPPVYLREHFK